MDRRGFLTLVGATAGASALGKVPGRGTAAASHPATVGDGGWAVLVDLTRCIGCRTCEAACAEANGLPEPDWSDDFEYPAPRPTTDRQWTAVSRYETSRGEVFVKRNCMHCQTPACAAGCLTKALVKTPEGPVIWRADRCMGCRYCMVSCPFDGPKFEYGEAVPKIQKCRMCFERVSDGGQPACVENCPNEALTFGRRDALLEEARRRIYQNPGDYVSHVYGEHEAGGTGFLYLSPVPFEELGFRTDLGDEAYPERTRDFLTAVPLVLVLWPAMLLAMRRATGNNGEVEAGAGAGEGAALPAPVEPAGKEERHDHR